MGEQTNNNLQCETCDLEEDSADIDIKCKLCCKGKEYVAAVGLAPEPSGYSKVYNPDVNPTTLADMVAGAYRSLHTYIPDKIDFVTEDRKVSLSIPISQGFHNPGPTFAVKENFDLLLRGQATQLQDKADQFISEEIVIVTYYTCQEILWILNFIKIQRLRNLKGNHK
ncbi:uncharacterized protein LOC103506470 [Diaphorina citri]|uniref:Uncharacterized protein LOC103506470 n=1 Tax=Diaphorina citri TaxID=121845 RepID=A0A1S3CWC2_DIACI|nr:uncharacterized protein LOC103506470 [Diaphorina citri]